MATNLADQAAAQEAAFAAASTAADQALAAARDELYAQGDADAVPEDERRTALGAEQHLRDATDRLAVLRAEEAVLRASLATASTPSLEDFETALRANLVAQATRLVDLRDAEERAERGRRALVRAGARVSSARAALTQATAWTAEATARQARLDALAAALAASPLDTVVADAAAALAGADHAAAVDRLAALLPAELRQRAADRYGEGLARAAAVAAVAADAAATRDDLLTSRSLDAGLAVAVARADVAERALQRYVATAAVRLARAEAMLTPLAAVADLTAAQSEAIDAAGRADAVAAVALEAAVAAGRSAYDQKDLAVAVAVVEALADDPDADPMAAAPVLDAVAQRDDVAVLGALDDARGAYGDTEAGALDEWEVEVPPALWAAAVDLADAEAELAALADQAARDALVTALDDAATNLADTVEAQRTLTRALLAVGAEADRWDDEVEVARRSERSRTVAFTRGDGRGGRHAGES